MFAVNRFVAAPNGTVSASAQNHSTRGSTYELAERPQVAASWQRRLRFWIPEIAGSSSWLTDSGPVAALDVLAGHTRIIHRLTAVLLSRHTCRRAA